MSYQPYDRSPSGIIFFGTNSTDQTFESVSTLVYDSGNNRFGINNAVPSGSLHVDNLQLDGNTLSAVDGSGNIYILPNNSGNIITGGNLGANSNLDLLQYSTINGYGHTLCSNTSRGNFNTTVNGCQNTIINNNNSYPSRGETISGGMRNIILTDSFIVSVSPNVIAGGHCNHILNGGYNVISGGYFHRACAIAGTIGGGINNCIAASGCYGSTISGGAGNQSNNSYSTVGGGCCNCATGMQSTVAGGFNNRAYGSNSTISGGYDNCAGDSSAVVGGSANCASNASAVVGGLSNTTGGSFTSFIGAGSFNEVANGLNTAIVAGTYNVASGDYSAIVGGQNNRTASTALHSFIGGGCCNTASGGSSTVGGGRFNSASGNCSTVSGGYLNSASANYSTVGGGFNNIATNDGFVGGSTVSGGILNCACGYFTTVSGGGFNSASAIYSTVSGGRRNCASGNNSTVSGGDCNCASATNSSVSGGCCNITNARHSVINGGHRNIIQSPTNECCSRGVTIGGGIGHNTSGGTLNAANGDLTGTITCCNAGAFSTISGGLRNCATGDCSVISGGSENTAAGDFSTVSAGYNNVASGDYSAIVGGYYNCTTSAYSLVMGSYNVACHTNAHIIGSGITSSAADTLYTNKICANDTITGTSIIKSGGTSSQFLKADGSVDSTGYTTCVGTVTSVAAGNGMNFGTITTTGSVALGTPSNVTLSSTNSVTSNSHTHAFAPGGDTTEYIRGDGSLATFPTNVASGVGSSGHIAFWTDANSLSYDNNQLFWDQENNRLGIGTNIPSYALDVAGAGRVTGNLNVNGDLIINGTTTTVNSTVVTIEDPILVLGSGTPSTDDNKDRGIAFNYFDGSAKKGFFGYDDDEQKFTFMTDATIAGEVVSGTVGTIKANLVGDVTGNADTATLATDASGLTSAVTIQLSGQLSGSDTFQDAGDTATITASLTSNAITDQTEITSVDGTNDHILIYDSGVGLRKVTPQNFIDDLNIVTSFNVSDGTTSVTVEQGETLNFADGTGAEFVVTSVGGQPTITVNSVDGEIVHDNLSGFVANEHIDHSAVSILGGSGLLNTGGDITSSRTLHIGAGNGITVAADSVALASTVAGSGLNYAAGVLNIGTGTGMSINGTTVGLANTLVTPGSYGTASQVGAFTVDQQGRLTAASGVNINITASQVSNFNTASESAIFTSGNFVDSTTIDFTVTAGASVTAGVKSNSINETHLTASVAGDGLSGGNGSPLSINAGDGLSISSDNLLVNVDNSTIEINSDTLRVKDGGITEAKLSRTVEDTFFNNDVIHADINLVSGGAGGITIKLPAPVIGKMVYVKKTDSAVGAITVARNGASDSIDGATQKILYSQYESLSFVSDGTQWYIV